MSDFTQILSQIESGDLKAAEQLLPLVYDAALGLAAAHQRGLIHRDVKPGNILLEDGEQVKITDFGLAHAADEAPLTHSGEVAGTPQFMSPKQAEGMPLGPRSDLFSFGAVLYAMCTGPSPFVASSVPAVLRAVCDTPARPVDEVNPGIPALQTSNGVRAQEFWKEPPEPWSPLENPGPEVHP